MKSALEVVREYFEAVKRLDHQGVMSFIDPEIVAIEPVSLPYGGIYRGIDDFSKNLVPALWGKLRLDINTCELIGSGDKIAALLNVTFTSHATGNQITLPYVEIYTVRNEKIIEADIYPSDTQRLIDFWNAN